MDLKICSGNCFCGFFKLESKIRHIGGEETTQKLKMVAENVIAKKISDIYNFPKCLECFLVSDKNFSLENEQ